MNDTDSDGDGLRDDLEITQRLTDPTRPDTDGDGFADGVDPDPLDPEILGSTAVFGDSFEFGDTRRWSSTRQ